MNTIHKMSIGEPNKANNTKSSSFAVATLVGAMSASLVVENN